MLEHKILFIHLDNVQGFPLYAFFCRKIPFSGCCFFHLHFSNVPLQSYQRYAYRNEELVHTFHLPKNLEKSVKEFSSYEEI